jgi:hypothetical protein
MSRPIVLFHRYHSYDVSKLKVNAQKLRVISLVLSRPVSSLYYV